MKKRFDLENLDCANCAAKMEDGIKKIEGILDARVSFITQKLIIEANEEDFDEIITQAAQVCKKVDSACKIKL